MNNNLLETDISLIGSILRLLGIDNVKPENVQAIELVAEREKPVFVSVHSFVNDNRKIVH